MNVGNNETNNETKIEPSKVTKPIQLLAAWLVGLIIVNGSFLTTSTLLDKTGSWLCSVLVIASVVNVPLFLISIFLLQTKFRPEMQEDVYYSKYIDKKFGNSKREITPDAIESLKIQNKVSNQELTNKINFLESSILDLTSELEKVTDINKVINFSEIRSNLELLNSPIQDRNFLIDKTVSLNQGLKNFKEINKALKEFDVPVHELFGKKLPDNLAIAFGHGFSKLEIETILKAVITVSDGLVTFADDEFAKNQYDNIVLIGSYETSEGLSISKYLDIIEGRNLSNHELYRLLSRHQRP